MVGRSETCSHEGAVIYLLEYAAKAKEARSCTDVPCGWLPPSMSNVPAKEIREMDFSSSTARLKRLEAIVYGEERSTSNKTRHQSLPMVSNEWSSAFLESLSQANQIAVGLSLTPEYCGPFKNPSTTFSLDLTKLYDPITEILTYSEILEKCKNVMNEMKTTPEERKEIEIKTRKQSKNVMWYVYRITGSMMYKIWQGNVNKPAKSTWEVICKGKSSTEESQRRKLQNVNISRGILNEKLAREYYNAFQKHRHTNFSVSLSGLVLHPRLPFIGSSPDGRVSCSCCVGYGCLEIKCPKEENLNECPDEKEELKKDHPYYFQVQTHMLVTGDEYCDSYLWLNKAKNTLVRVYCDKKRQEEMELKCTDYFYYIILPEMVSHFFTRTDSKIIPLLPSMNNIVLPNICYCQQPRHDPIAICAGASCSFKEFHCQCVDLMITPRTEWFCPECKPAQPLKKRRTAVIIEGEN